MDNTVIVYLLTDDANHPRVNHVESLFSEDIFQVNVVTIDPLPNTDINHIANEINKFKWCLTNAEKHHSKNYFIIIKDTSISRASPVAVSDIVRTAVNMLKKDMPLCYLCKWHDRCDLYRDSDKKQVLNRPTYITKTVSPHGVQALLVSPHGRDLLLGKKALKNGKYFNISEKSLSLNLNEHIVSGTLEATCTYPNLFEAEHIKDQECLGAAGLRVEVAAKIKDVVESKNQILTQIDEARNSACSPLSIWIFVIVVILLLIALFFAAGKLNCFTRCR